MGLRGGINGKALTSSWAKGTKGCCADSSPFLLAAAPFHKQGNRVSVSLTLTVPPSLSTSLCYTQPTNSKEMVKGKKDDLQDQWIHTAGTKPPISITLGAAEMIL